MLSPRGFPRVYFCPMTVSVSETLGFCDGVHRAIDLAHRTLDRALSGNRRLYFYGQIVHNDNVCAWFTSRGVEVIKEASEASENSVIVIRAHGITDNEREALLRKNVEIVDATCPVVLKGQKLVRESEKDVLIFGYNGHSEVLSLLGSAVRKAMVVSSLEDLDKIEGGVYNGVVQTTFSTALLKVILEKAGEKGIIIDMLNHICKASIKRREAVEKLVDKVACFVVVGDKNSANTRELGTIVKNAGKPCFLVNGADDIPSDVYAYESVGVTAGASTPRDFYRKVIEKLEG